MSAKYIKVDIQSLRIDIMPLDTKHNGFKILRLPNGNIHLIKIAEFPD